MQWLKGKFDKTAHIWNLKLVNGFLEHFGRERQTEKMWDEWRPTWAKEKCKETVLRSSKMVLTLLNKAHGKVVGKKIDLWCRETCCEKPTLDLWDRLCRWSWRRDRVSGTASSTIEWLVVVATSSHEISRLLQFFHRVEIRWRLVVLSLKKWTLSRSRLFIKNGIGIRGEINLCVKKSLNFWKESFCQVAIRSGGKCRTQLG